MPRITKLEALQRTKIMLRREWRITAPAPYSTDDLRKPPPGLGKNDYAIRALERPIEVRDFADVSANVTGSALVAATNVTQLRDKIWDGIPAGNKSVIPSRP